MRPASTFLVIQLSNSRADEEKSRYVAVKIQNDVLYTRL